MIAGENAKAPGIIWDRLVKTKLCGEIRNRILNRAARSGFSVSVLARKIIAECVMDLLQLAQESFVLRNFLEA